MEQYYGTTVILESEPINIPNTKKCRANHGLMAAVPSEDMTFGVFRTLGYKARLKSLQKQQRDIEEENRKEIARLKKQF